MENDAKNLSVTEIWNIHYSVALSVTEMASDVMY